VVNDSTRSWRGRWLEHVRGIRMRTWILLFVLAVVVNPFSYLQISSASFRFQEASGGSMEPTVPVGHWFMLNGLAYGDSDPQRGDIVGLTTTYDGETKGLLKRVVGLPGEKVQLYGGVVYINDVPLDEPYLDQPAATWDDWPVYLGAEEYYVLGDNRRDSLDSRRVGPVQRSEIHSRMDALGPGFRSGEVTPAAAVALLETTTFMLLLSVGHLIAGCLLVWRRRCNQWWAIPAFLGWGVWIAVLWVVLRPRSAEEVERKPNSARADTDDQPARLSPADLPGVVLLTFMMVMLAFDLLLSAFGMSFFYAAGAAFLFTAGCLSIGAAFGRMQDVLGLLLWKSLTYNLAFGGGTVLGLGWSDSALLASISVLAPMMMVPVASKVGGLRPSADVRIGLGTMIVGQLIWFGAATIYVPVHPVAMALGFGVAAVAILADQLQSKTGSVPYVAVLGALGLVSIFAGGPWLLTSQIVLPFAMLILLVRDLERMQLKYASDTEAVLQPAT
jgi:signal peptidase I